MELNWIKNGLVGEMDPVDAVVSRVPRVYGCVLLETRDIGD